QDLVVRLFQSEDLLFQLVDVVVEIVEHRRVEVDDLVQDLVAEESGTAAAENRAGAQQLFDVIDAAERVVMVSDDVVLAEKAVELDRIEAVGTGVGAHAVNDEIQITGKLFDLWIMAIFATVFDGERVKLKDVEQDALVRYCRRIHVDPDHA